MTSTTLHALTGHHQDTTRDIGQVRAEHLCSALSDQPKTQPEPDHGLPRWEDHMDREWHELWNPKEDGEAAPAMPS